MVPPPSSHRRQLTHGLRDLLSALACLTGHALFLLVSWLRYERVGFPLDDAWIYQTYARNLAVSGQWAFVPNVPSTGSTSILWTLLIAPAHLLRIAPWWWTQAVGFLTLIALALGAARLFEEDPPRTSLLVGIGVGLEWHLVWAAASGMETSLFAALLVWFWLWLRRRDPDLVGHRWQDGLLLGLWGGLLMLARPEGVLAAVVGGLYGLIVPGRLLHRIGWAVAAAVGFDLIVAPFFGLNFALSSSIWPNTFYAKQTEYAALWAVPYLQRLWEQLSVAFVGPQILLLPGLVHDLYRDFRYRTDRISLVPWLWVIMHLALYAARLPVIYQHGRYAMPIIPLIVIYGVRGTLRLARPRALQAPVRLISMAWLTSLALIFPLFLGLLGAPAYGRDVAFIEDEMVQTAHWVRRNIGAGVVIAAHDIGALGYYAPHPLVDLAGLISPEVIPHMNDAGALTRFVLLGPADYLIAFPNWNPQYQAMLASPHFCAIWSAAEVPGYRGASGLGPMTVYWISREGDCFAIPRALRGVPLTAGPALTAPR